MKIEFSRHIVEKSSNTKFHENSSSGSRGVRCGQTDRQTDTAKLIFFLEILLTHLKRVKLVLCFYFQFFCLPVSDLNP